MEVMKAQRKSLRKHEKTRENATRRKTKREGGAALRASAAGAKNLKVTPDASRLTAELLRLFVQEAVRRASAEAMVNEDTEVGPRHLEIIMAKLLLDF